MKSKKRSREQILSCCSNIGPDDGVDPKTFFRKSGRKKTNRKALQMCGEIAQTISQVLAWESSDDLLRSLEVHSVVPAPDSTRVLVTVYVPRAMKNVNDAQVEARLVSCRGKLRTEAAAAIHRKRVPELAFRVLRREEASDD
jgi:ribosome-binding factor A